MQLPPDTQIGPYRIEGLIASGGMGEVYRAWHSQLQRRVAIKAVAENAELSNHLLKRFSREARLASQLDHPHICRVYDLIEHQGRPLLVLEYLEGETLSARLARDRLSARETMTIGAELAEALDHAHAHGLIHRDLKPGNVMLTASGARILDFGLVKRTGSSDLADDDVSSTLSDSDVMLGTLPYMAPEQVQGGAADARSDIYALGVILYRCITGRLPFVRPTNAALAAAILHDTPDTVDTLVPSTSTALAHVIGRCLEKDRRNRWQTARDLASELRWLLEQGGQRWSFLRNRRVRLGLAGAAVLGLGAIAWFTMSRFDGPDGPAARAFASSIVAPPGVAFQSNHPDAVISPDGEQVLLSGIDSAGQAWLWVRPLSEPVTRRIDVAVASHTPFWAPDGNRIGYFSRGSIRLVDLRGGPSEFISSVSLESRGASWGSRGVILFAPEPDGGLVRVTPGSPPEPITRPNRARGEIGHVWPHFLPDGEHFIFLITSAEDSVRGIYFASLSEPASRRLLASSTSAWYASGQLLYVHEGALVARPFDPATGRLSPESRVVAGSVATLDTYAAFSASSNGVLTYSRAESKDVTALTWRDTLGFASGSVGQPARYRNPALSRNGRLAVEMVTQGAADMWIRDLRSNRTSRTNDPALEPRNPVWSPDGASVLFESRRTDGWALHRWDIDSAAPPQLVSLSATEQMPTDWSPDGNMVLLADRTRRGDYDVTALDLITGESRVWFGGQHQEFSARFSPSGRLVAFVSNATGTFETFVDKVPATGVRCRVSVNGGWDPQWGADDVTLYYLEPDGTLMRARIQLSSGCVVGSPDVLFETAIDPRTSRNHYAFDATRGRFLVNGRTSDPRSHTIEVLINWDVAAKGGGGS